MSTSPLQSPTFSATASALFGAGAARSEVSDDSFARMLRDFDTNLAPPSGTAQPVPVAPAAPEKAPSAAQQEAKPADEGEQAEDGATSDIQRDNARLEARRHGAAPTKARANTDAKPTAEATAAEATTALAAPGIDAKQVAQAEEPQAGKATKGKKPLAEQAEAEPAATSVAAAASTAPEAAQSKTPAAPATEAEASSDEAAPAPTRGGPAYRSAVVDASRQAARADAAQQSGDAAQASAQASGNFAAALAQQTTPAAASARGESAPASFNPAAPLAALAGAPAELSARPAAAATPASPIALAQPLHAPAFASEMAARLSLAAADGVQEAQLHLNPSEMGPVAVQIVVDGQQAQISFHAEQADTRQVLEQSLPELAAALREQGLTLSGGGVFQQQQQTAQQDAGAAQPGSARGTAARVDGPAGAAAERAPTAMRTPRGVVDVYA